MFTVANQKAIAFHFHPDMFDLKQAVVLKERTLCVSFEL